MKFFDRSSNLQRAPNDVEPLIRGFLQNKRKFTDDAADAPFVTEALKYKREQQDRRQTSPYQGENEFVEELIDIFGFDPLDFQVNSWQTIQELNQDRVSNGKTRAALFSAPTGFGKTEAFLGPLYKLLADDQQESAIIVYPRRALLQNQLERILEHIHEIRGDGPSPISVGVYIGNMPYTISRVEDNNTFFEPGGTPRFRLANCWCGTEENAHSFEYDGTSREYTISCEHNEDHSFTDRELLLARQDIVDSPPDIILTTLEALELFSLKPNYDLIDAADTIVLDEVHLYTGLRGAHAGKIIRNINDITDQPLLWLGASATVDNPARFAKKLFDLPGSAIDTEQPPDSDFQSDPDDFKHYYFMISPEESVGASSMMIQQLMLLGHSMLDNGEERGTALSFIDSISQVNQKHAQFQDADKVNKLWQYHRSGPTGENWDDIADEMGHQFIDEPLSFLPVYSDEGFDATAAARSDVLVSTSFLEVGIDVGDINIVTQFRQPHNLSSFIQRTGRAARKEDMNSHIGVFLSNFTGDANMFYRAERFLGSDLRTPLKPDNDVVEWIHDRLKSFYEISSNIYNRRIRRPRDEKLTFYEEYVANELEFEEFYTFLTAPGEYLNDTFGIGRNISAPLIEPASVRGVNAALNAKQAEIDADFDEIDEYIETEGQNIEHTANAFGDYLRRVEERLLDLIQTFETRLEEYSEVLTDHGQEPAEADELADEVANLRSEIERQTTRSQAERVLEYNEMLAGLAGVAGRVKGVRAQAGIRTDDDLPDVEMSAIDDIQDAIDLLEGLADDEQIDQLNEQRRQIYYLKQAIEHVAEFNDLDLTDDSNDDDRNDRPQLSLWYVKNLLRAAYYFDRFLAVTDDEPDEEVWYVPPNYFESSGQYFTVFNGPNDLDGTEESIDSLVHSYAPFRSEYTSQPGRMRLFMPETDVVEPGDGDEHSTVEFDFENVQTDDQPNMRVPESIRLDDVTDLTEDAAQNIVRYCPQCLQIISDTDTCLRHNDKTLGKIHSYPQIQTITSDRNVEEQYGHLALCDLTGDVTLEGVTLKITPAQYAGEQYGYTWIDDADRIEREITSPDPPLGFSLETRGLVFDLDDFVRSLDEDVKAQIAQYKEFEDIDFEYIVTHTAAHFFLQMTADLGGVNPSMLFYGMDDEANEVYVFERTEGGQGIVDLVFNEFHINPGDALQSLNRIAFNPQVINERLWADPNVIRALPFDEPVSEESVADIIAEHTEIPYDNVQERVVEEFLSTVDRASQLQLTLDADSLALPYRIKHHIAQAQVDGEDDFPDERLSSLDIDLNKSRDTITSLFVSPDIDGCVENLHISECISGHDQEDSLSYVILEQLYEHLLTTVPADDATETVLETERLPAAEVNDTNIFLTF